MFDFKNLNSYDVESILERGINPITGSTILEKDKESVAKMVMIIHSAIQDYEIDFSDNFVFIPATNAEVKIIEQTTIRPFANKIFKALLEVTHKYTNSLTIENIQFAICDFLINNGFIELKSNPYSKNKNSYFATGLGKQIGLINYVEKTKKNNSIHKLIYSCYVQAYLIRMLPEILYSKFYKDYFSVHSNDLIDKTIEPLSLDEQELIVNYRELNTSGQKLIKSTINTLLTSSEANTQIKNKLP